MLMDRIFHARIAAGQYAALLLFGGLLVYCLWVKYVGIALLWCILLLHFIEKLIHTTYTLTADGRLVLYLGRFARKREIALDDIASVESVQAVMLGRLAVRHYVLVHLKNGKCEMLMPVNEEDFIHALNKRLNA